MIELVYVDTPKGTKMIPVRKDDAVVYLLWDNSGRDPVLLGVFASKWSARQWLDGEYASGAMRYCEYASASIEKYEVTP